MPKNVVDKNIWIRENVSNLSFADIGGLWGTVNERITVAIQANAQSATMIDIADPESKWWNLFHQRCQEIGVSDLSYQCLQADICKPNIDEAIGSYDFVHCSGIIYHVADLFNFVKNLYQVSNKYLIISSMVVPDIIENEEGKVEFPEGCCYCIPLINDKNRKVIAKYFTDLNLRIRGLNDNNPIFISPDGEFQTAPWWWLFSPSTLKRMMLLFPFEVIDEGFTWQNRSYSLFLQVIK